MTRQYSSCPSRVYPRVCGGTLTLSLSPPAWAGLSPRVRGNRGAFAPAEQNSGSIPACAGEPGVTLAIVGDRYPGGLSPRVRGNPASRYRMAMGARSIPACAGEPP